MPIKDLEPKYLWRQFDNIRKVPRPSKHEEKIRDYLLGFAEGKGLETKVDGAGNVVIRVPATEGHEKAPTVVLQSHMDMVCEKNKGVDFDFMNDPIELERDGDWLKAKGTTLGSDNGVGLAAALACAEDPDVVHGPLELLVTVDEETGLTGAAQLEPSLLEGRRLLNLDTEEIGALYIGCAGGGDINLTLPMKTVSIPKGGRAFHVKVKGLRGGHSGIDIAEQRGNANKALARMLWHAGRDNHINLVRFEGGGVHNAIPREAEADCVADASRFDDIARALNEEGKAIHAELGRVEPGFTVEISVLDDNPAHMMDDETTSKVLNMIMSIPHGVDTMSNDVPGLVETSNNLASVWTKEKTVVIGSSSRSSVASAFRTMIDRIRIVGEMAGAESELRNAYPGWKPDLDSEVLAITKRVHERVFNEEPELKAVHAGLECGIIGEKCPGMDMISFGPLIEAPHSPDERVNIPSVAHFWKLLTAVLEEMA